MKELRKIYNELEGRYETKAVDYDKYRESVWRSWLINSMNQDKRDYGIEQD